MQREQTARSMHHTAATAAAPGGMSGNDLDAWYERHHML